MKLARNIAEIAVEKMIKSGMISGCGEPRTRRKLECVAAIEPIIAEKLRPIHEALAILWQDSGTPASEIMEKYEEALEMLDEEA